MANRNSQAHFELAPQVAVERSTFDRSCNMKTSFNAGQLIPFYVDEVLPGDTFQIETSKVVRMPTLVNPIMDNMYLDTYYFFVPNRLVWTHWRQFCGENTNSAWYPEVEYTIPKILMPKSGWRKGTIADYMGIPINVTTADDQERIEVNALPFRAYALICNEWFRDENLVRPLTINSTVDATVEGSNENTYAAPARGGQPFVAAKYHDYFTSCLPAPQKGPAVNFIDGILPVKTSAVGFIGGTGNPALQLRNISSGANAANAMLYTGAAGRVSYNPDYPPTEEQLSLGANVFPSNLYASLSDLSDLVGSELVRSERLTVNNLRQAFQIQRMFEKDARGGTRYIEILKTHFGVTSPDARLQRPEYLGGNRVPINVQQVPTTTYSSANRMATGHLGAFSQTNDSSYDVEKSFVEHGYIIGLMCVRYEHSYSQGLERMWNRTTRFDFYWPALAHLGEQAVLTDEIYLDAANGSRDVFGYQEAWAEYRYKPNYMTGAMRPFGDDTTGDFRSEFLPTWSLGDIYASTPYLSEDWIKEDSSNVDRTLAFSSEVETQFFADIYVKNKCTRAMPLYSIPGLIDHF